MQNRRQKLSFKSAFELRMTRYMVALVSFTLVILALSVLFLFLWSPIPRQLLIITDPYAQSTARIFANTIRALFIFFFVVSFLFLWLTSVVATKIVGPFVRLRRVLEQMARGDAHGEVRFRKGDEAPFQGLTEPLNRVLASLRHRQELLREIEGSVQSLLERARASNASGEIIEALHDLKERLAKIS